MALTNPPPPPSRVEVKERIQLCLYSPSGSLWSILGWSLPLPYIDEFCSVQRGTTKHDKNLGGYVSIHTKISLGISHHLSLETSRCVNLLWHTLCSKFRRNRANCFTFIHNSHNDWWAPSQDTHHHAEVHRISASRALACLNRKLSSHTHTHMQDSTRCPANIMNNSVQRVTHITMVLRVTDCTEQDNWTFSSQTYRWALWGLLTPPEVIKLWIIIIIIMRQKCD